MIPVLDELCMLSRLQLRRDRLGGRRGPKFAERSKVNLSFSDVYPQVSRSYAMSPPPHIQGLSAELAWADRSRLILVIVMETPVAVKIVQHDNKVWGLAGGDAYPRSQKYRDDR